jgi:hypothetical protein
MPVVLSGARNDGIFCTFLHGSLSMAGFDGYDMDAKPKDYGNDMDGYDTALTGMIWTQSQIVMVAG